MRSLSRRRLLGATAAALALVAGPASAGFTPTPGGSGIGDDYYPLDGNGGIDVRSYSVRVDYRFGTGRLVGDTRLVVRATQALSRFNLDLLLPVDGVWIDGEPVRFSKPDPHELQVTPDQALVPGEAVRVRVTYAGRPAAKSYLGEANWLADEHEVVAMNEPHMAPWWFPANDHPRDRARFDVRVTVPRDKQVVANGERRWRRVDGRLATTRWTADEPMVPYLAYFAAGAFQTASGTWGADRSWYAAVSKRFPDTTERSFLRLMKEHDELADGLAQDLGPYPFSTTGGLVTYLDPGFALENQTRPTYDASSAGRSTVVHELAHQWFGDLVAVDRWRDIWLNEGPATFMEWRYRELNGGASAAGRLRGYYDTLDAGEPFWDRVVSDPGAEIHELFSAPVYVRGAMTLQALRNRVGEDDFWQVLRDWLDVDPAVGRTGATEEFEALAEAVSGEELTPFFDAWLHTGQKPADTAANGLGPESRLR